MMSTSSMSPTLGEALALTELLGLVDADGLALTLRLAEADALLLSDALGELDGVADGLAL